MIDKHWIENNLLTVTGGLNNRVCIETWWYNKNLSKELTELMQSYGDTIPHKVYSIYHDQYEPSLCVVCNKPSKFSSFKVGYTKYCSKDCMYVCPERNNKIATNRDYTIIHEKVKKTNLEKYGVEHYFSTKESVTKIKQTKLDRHGNEYYNNKDKSMQTCLERYGVKHTTQAPSVIQKMQASKDHTYPTLRSKEWLIEENKTKSTLKIAEELGATPRTVWLWFQKYNIEPNQFPSEYGKEQKQFHEFVQSLFEYHVQSNDRRIINPKELDIYIRDLNIAFEYNGLYWHAEDKERHIQKHNLCKEKGIRLYQFWNNEWLYKKEIVKSIVRSIVGKTKRIYARNCSVLAISSKKLSSFLEENHIQGSVNCSIRYGLFHDGELVSVIGAGKSRFDKQYTHELLRFCHKLNTTVVGGFSKLFKYTISNNQIESMQTFSDIRLFDGKSYEKVGFVHSHDTKPGYFYFRGSAVKNRIALQKHKLSTELENYDPSLTADKNCYNNGWLKVYDCGMSCFVWRRQ